MKMVKEKQYFFLQFHKAVIENQTKRQMLQMPTDIFPIVMLKVAETTKVEQEKNNHSA